MLSPRGHLAASEDIFVCHNGGRNYWYLTEDRDVMKHSTIHRTDPFPTQHQRILPSNMPVVLRMRAPG